ncbi:MAG TPA: chorismate synthase [Candidatus Nanopelagicales bacterium]|nr:chorismate synthase [Candidatus Nanopelagicales bacterium]
MIGSRLRLLTAGESHGPRLLGILDGMPAGVPLSAAVVDGYLWRRQGGVGRGARMKIERDRAQIVAGVWKGATSGAPVGITIENRSVIPEDSQPIRTVPRPGHADLTGMLKHGLGDANPAIERSSARETAMRVALGAVAQALLRELGVAVFGHVVSIGGIEASPDRSDWGALVRARDRSPLYCADPAVEQAMLARIEEAKERQETLGGVAEVVALGVPPGLGSYSQWDTRIEASLAEALLSIQSVKAAAIGDGVATAGELGRGAQDEIFWDGGIARRTNRAGGIEGGITNGEPVVARAWFKPISTQRRPLRSVDLATGEETECRYIRSDTLIVPAGSVVAEAMLAIAVADALLAKLGGDHVDDTRAALDQYAARIPWRRPGLPAPLTAPPAPPPEPVEEPAEET